MKVFLWRNLCRVTPRDPLPRNTFLARRGKKNPVRYAFTRFFFALNLISVSLLAKSDAYCCAIIKFSLWNAISEQNWFERREYEPVVILAPIREQIERRRKVLGLAALVLLDPHIAGLLLAPLKFFATVESESSDNSRVISFRNCVDYQKWLWKTRNLPAISINYEAPLLLQWKIQHLMDHKL